MQRHDELRKTGLSLEVTIAPMIKAYKPATNPLEYSGGDLVKVSIHVLPEHCSSTKVGKLLPTFIGPFEDTKIVAAGAICL